MIEKKDFPILEFDTNPVAKINPGNLTGGEKWPCDKLIITFFPEALNKLINLGWLLSFGSYAGIMILGPRIQKFFFKEKKPGFIAGMILTTVSATLMTMPVTLYYFGQISLISVLANLLILPTLPYAMGLTFLAGVFSGIPILSNVIAFLATKMLDFHIFTVDKFSEMRQFLVTIPVGRGEVFLIYAVILGCLIYGVIKKRKKRLDLWGKKW